MNRYFGLFNCPDDIVEQFQIDAKLLDNVTILFAWYEYENYSGEAHVIFYKDGIMYEAEGSHCSCMGLEGQWEPIEINVEVLRMRYKCDAYRSEHYLTLLRPILDVIEFDTELEKVLN